MSRIVIVILIYYRHKTIDNILLMFITLLHFPLLIRIIPLGKGFCENYNNSNE
jgi:hypothetical protein